MKIKIIIRSIRHWWQRLIKGFSDDETWSLDYSLSKIILPRLKRFKELTPATPHYLTSKEWHKRLDKMIAAFEFYGSDERWNDFFSEEHKKHQEGIRLFAEHYGDLWW